MSIYKRSYTTGGTYFFTVVTYSRQPLLTIDPVRKALREAITSVRLTYPFTIDAWVLLPDHLHCIWTLPPGDAEFSRRWSIIKRLVSKQCAEYAEPTENRSHINRREFSFWQRRFWEHQIRDEANYRNHADYIHWNPVKHGYAATANDWPFSTFHNYVKRGVYSLDWGGCPAERPGDFWE